MKRWCDKGVHKILQDELPMLSKVRQKYTKKTQNLLEGPRLHEIILFWGLWSITWTGIKKFCVGFAGVLFGTRGYIKIRCSECRRQFFRLCCTHFSIFSLIFVNFFLIALRLPLHRRRPDSTCNCGPCWCACVVDEGGAQLLPGRQVPTHHTTPTIFERMCRHFHQRVFLSSGTFL